MLMFMDHACIRPVLRPGIWTKYPAYTLDVPINHFGFEDPACPEYNKTFPLRYWFDAKYYQAGGTVFVVEGGETSGEDRLPYLSHGILKILSEATHGLSVVLEHRWGHRFDLLLFQLKLNELYTRTTATVCEHTGTMESLGQCTIFQRTA